MRPTRLVGLALAVQGTLWSAVTLESQVFRSTIQIVKLDVLVRHRGHPVRGLVANDFVVRDNGIAQTVQLFSVDEAPVSLIVVLDTSGSVRGPKLRALVDAVSAALASLSPADTAGLIAFSQRIRIVVEPTSNRDAVRAALNRLDASGGTALVDAVHAATVFTANRPGRSLVLVFSDGLDNISWLSQASVLETVRRSEVVVYFVAPTLEFMALPFQQWRSRDEPEETFPVGVSRAAGGRVLVASSNSQLEASFESIVREFKARYLLGYSPTGVEEGGWHRVEVRLRRGVRGEVTARPGYVAGQVRRRD